MNDSSVLLLALVLLILIAGSAVVIFTASGVVAWISALAVRGVAMVVARASTRSKE